MQKLSHRARALVLAGLAAGTVTLTSASPAGAIGPVPIDPTTQPQVTYPGAPTNGEIFRGWWILPSPDAPGVFPPEQLPPPKPLEPAPAPPSVPPKT